jgi:hypothetical protein
MLDQDFQQLAANAICHEAMLAGNAWQLAAWGFEKPSVRYRPALSVDGNMYCALYGSNLVDGVAGFGETAEKAMADFDKNWVHQKASSQGDPQ